MTGSVVNEPVQPRELVTIGGVEQRRAERGEAVDQEDDRGRGRRSRGTVVEDAVEPVEEAAPAGSLRHADDGADVRQSAQIAEHAVLGGAGSRVEGVEVQCRGRAAGGQCMRHGGERRRRATPERPRQHEVTVGRRPAMGALLLAIRIVDEPDHPLR